MQAPNHGRGRDSPAKAFSVLEPSKRHGKPPEMTQILAAISITPHSKLEHKLSSTKREKPDAYSIDDGARAGDPRLTNAKRSIVWKVPAGGTYEPQRSNPFIQARVGATRTHNNPRKKRGALSPSVNCGPRMWTCSDLPDVLKTLRSVLSMNK